MPKNSIRTVLIAVGISASIFMISTSLVETQSTKAAKIQNFRKKLYDIAFCQKGYEISSSFPSYGSRKAPTLKDRLILEEEADLLQAKSEKLEKLFDGSLRDEAENNGIESFDFGFMVREIKEKAEREAIMIFQQVEDPNEFLDHLDLVCSSHLK